jgi:hypothetical protein
MFRRDLIIVLLNSHLYVELLVEFTCLYERYYSLSMLVFWTITPYGLQVDINVSEEHAAFIFRDENSFHYFYSISYFFNIRHFYSRCSHNYFTY